MALKIRLSRVGAKRQPSYRLVVTDSRAPRDGRFIEKVGTYNPLLKKDDPQRVTLKIERLQEWLVLKAERIKHWMSVGALPTERAQRLLSTAGITQMPTIHPQTKQDKPRAKTQERMRAAEEMAKAAAEAAAAAGAAS